MRLPDGAGESAPEGAQSEALRSPGAEAPDGFRPTGLPCDRAPKETQRQRREPVSSQQSVPKTGNKQRRELLISNYPSVQFPLNQYKVRILQESSRWGLCGEKRSRFRRSVTTGRIQLLGRPVLSPRILEKCAATEWRRFHRSYHSFGTLCCGLP